MFSPRIDIRRWPEDYGTGRCSRVLGMQTSKKIIRSNQNISTDKTWDVWWSMSLSSNNLKWTNKKITLKSHQKEQKESLWVFQKTNQKNIKKLHERKRLVYNQSKCSLIWVFWMIFLCLVELFNVERSNLFYIRIDICFHNQEEWRLHLKYQHPQAGSRRVFSQILHLGSYLELLPKSSPLLSSRWVFGWWWIIEKQKASVSLLCWVFLWKLRLHEDYLWNDRITRVSLSLEKSIYPYL